ncbi:MAG: hypothetical protein E7618_07615 [Ruminococcaceae bacterium]|nr:hypothetical protein [Oscillospiraceae bacterium]
MSRSFLGLMEAITLGNCTPKGTATEGMHPTKKQDAPHPAAFYQNYRDKPKEQREVFLSLFFSLV